MIIFVASINSLKLTFAVTGRDTEGGELEEEMGEEKKVKKRRLTGKSGCGVGHGSVI